MPQNYLHLEVWVGGICGSRPRTVLRPTHFECVAYAHSAKMPHNNILLCGTKSQTRTSIGGFGDRIPNQLEDLRIVARPLGVEPRPSE